jgi:hypothetical protein
LLRY